MACAFAHITVVNSLNRDTLINAQISGKIADAITDYHKFCDLGSISPDMSYLAVEPECSDLMHFEKTGKFVREAVELLMSMDEGIEKNKCIAWLFGYVSHMITDMVIHPIIEKKVGRYGDNPTNALNHRKCEMHQDVYIFRRLNLGDFSQCEIAESRIKACHGEIESMLDIHIYNFWVKLFNNVHSEKIIQTPNIHKWFNCFSTSINYSEEGDALSSGILKRVKVFGHGIDESLINTFNALKENGFIYPSSHEVDPNGGNICNLPTPEGPTHYDLLFDKAVENVLKAWVVLSNALSNKNTEYKTFFLDWDLGTGVILSNNKFLYWMGYLEPNPNVTSSNQNTSNKKKDKAYYGFALYNKLSSIFDYVKYRFKQFILAIGFIIAIIIASLTGIDLNNIPPVHQNVSINQVARPSESELDELGPKTLLLSGYVEKYISNNSLPQNISAKEIIDASSKHDLDTLNAFKKFDVAIQHNKKNVILLIGSKSRNEKYFEDRSWTFPLDERFTNEVTMQKFDFTISKPEWSYIY